jgi:hypothetical protein
MAGKRSTTHPALRLLLPLGELCHLLCKLLIALEPHEAVVSWRLRWSVVLLCLVRLPGCRVAGCLLLLLLGCLALLGQFPHGLNECQVFRRPPSGHTHRCRLAVSPDRRCWRTRGSGLLLSVLVVLLNESLRRLDPIVVHFEVRLFLQLARQSLQVDPTLETLPRRAPLSSR